MKKFIFGLMAFAMMFASCSKSADTTTDAQQKLYNDSISEAYGTFVGSVIANQSSWTPEQKKDFLRAFQTVLNMGDSASTRHGATVGAQMAGEFEQFTSIGVTLDREIVISNFRKAFEADSISTQDAMQANQEFQRQYMAARQRFDEKSRAERAESAEAQQNIVSANNYVANLKNEDADVKTTESGLTYKVNVAGNEAKTANENSTVTVDYVGKHLNGQIFDQGENASFNLQGVIPGFREGLQLVGEGGEVTLYIPGDLAYGLDGQPNAGIGPNEMLIFELKLKSVAE